MKRSISEQKTVGRSGIAVRVITYDDGSIEEVPADPAAALSSEAWALKTGGPIGVEDDGTQVNGNDVQALRKFLYSDKK